MKIAVDELYRVDVKSSVDELYLVDVKSFYLKLTRFYLLMSKLKGLTLVIILFQLE